MDVFIDERIEAAHRLPNVLPGHKCGRLHGHSFKIRVRARGDVDAESGWVLDFADLKALVRREVHDRLDHNYLNDVKGLENPTSENLARWVWSKVAKKVPAGAQLVSVTVRETCTSGATCRGDA